MQFYQCSKSLKITVLYMTNSTNLGVNILSIIYIVINVFSLQNFLWAIMYINDLVTEFYILLNFIQRPQVFRFVNCQNHQLLRCKSLTRSFSIFYHASHLVYSAYDCILRVLIRLN